MKKIFPLLALLLLISFPFAYQIFTDKVDDYTNGKSGIASKSYEFTLDGDKMDALGTNDSATDMTWAQWLNIDASGFNENELYGVVSGSGITKNAAVAYTIAYATNGGTFLNNDFVYAGNSIQLPLTTYNGHSLTGWYILNADGSKGNYVGKPGDPFLPTSNTRLTAVWQENDINDYVKNVVVNPSSYVYDGSDKKPSVTVTPQDGITLVEGTDYTIEYRILKTTKIITTEKIRSASDVSGYTIVKDDEGKDEIAGCGSSCTEACQYDETTLMNPPICYWYSRQVEKEEKRWSACTGECKITETDTYRVAVVGKGEYSGEIVSSYTINQKNIADSDIIVEDISKQIWTGSAIEPKVEIKYNTMTLTEGRDFTISYSNNVSVGTATITITGIGNYHGERTKTFVIDPKPISVTVVNGIFTYDGNDISGKITEDNKPRVISDPSDATIRYYSETTKDYTLTSVPTDYVNVGEYTVCWQVFKTGYATETGELTIEIVKPDNVITTHSDSNLSENSETNSLVIRYPDSGRLYYKLKYKDKATVSVVDNNGLVDTTINGNEITFKPKKDGEGYVTINVGETDNTKQTKKQVYITVLKGKITATPTNEVITYDYERHTPKLEILPAGTTNNFTYILNNVVNTSSEMPFFTNVGVYNISYAIGKDYYEPVNGQVTLEIQPKDLLGFDVTYDHLEFEYDGTTKKPIPTIIDKDKQYTLIEGQDYIVTYKNNIMPSVDSSEKPTVTIEGIGNFKGTKVQEFTIKPSTIKYVVTHGKAEYTGYEQTGGAMVTVSAPSGYDLQYSDIQPYCENSRPNCSKDDMIYRKGYNVPKFTNVGTYTVYYRIKAKGYDTVTGELSIEITRAMLEKPVLFENLIYTGKSQTPVFRNYNSKFMTIEGNTKGTEPGEYVATFKLTDENVSWKDDTRDDWNVRWSIAKIDIREHEDVVNMPIKYNEMQQLSVGDGKTTFDRVGYAQTGWVEDCVDIKTGNGELYDRYCNYSKFTPFSDDKSITKTSCLASGYSWIDNSCHAEVPNTYNTQESCEAKGYEWYSNKCYTKANLYDIGSTVSGMFVAQNTKSCELIEKLGYVKDEYTNRDSCEANNGKWWNDKCYDTTTSLANSTKDESYDLFAAWSPVVYRIQYDTCDAKGCGELRGNPKTIVSYDEPFTVEAPKRLGYEFAGWTITNMDDTIHTIGYDTLDVVEFTTPEAWSKDVLTFKNLTSVEDMTVVFTANWTPISYTVKYDPNVNNEDYRTDWGDTTNKYAYKDENGNLTTANVKGVTDEQIREYDIPLKLSKNNFVLDGYTFVGWNTRPDGKGNMVSDETVATITDVNIYNRGNYQVFADELDGVVNLANLELLDNHISYHTSPGKDPIDVLNEIIREGVTLYAQWQANNKTEFTITYWVQNIHWINADGTEDNSYNTHNGANYTKVGVETYSGVSDTNVTITPYNYNIAGTSEISNNLISKKFQSNGDSENLKEAGQITNRDAANNNNIRFVRTTSAAIKDDLFYGFTPELTDNSSITNGNGSAWNKEFAKDPNDGSLPTNQYTYIILPDGSRNINIYYRRNKYMIDYYTNGGSNTNPLIRLYQVSVMLANPGEEHLLNGANSDDGGTNNSGLGNFINWYRASNLSGSLVNGINGEVGTRENLYAKYLQYRYTLNTGGWTHWKKQESN